ncbi:hypothetical protein XYCOK13_14890 [Xylanibacillus composti]|uniref:Flagellar hook-length control protein FliK n=1 Tax=Xylanibacillus composti TaxID=1572762 RepID=A0A8J4H2Y1_9BACL|nr:hypothetical protein [Xylanibacillus composti]GIQ68665.1 hypothetical protein XYCOK13_14890 [Xylanibacillus composti]
MQISQLMRSVMGETRPAEGKALELKAGQVVRGMVMQWLSNQDALVQIEGVQVKARLAAALEKGQTALLQVLAESKDGALALKLLTALQGSGAASLDDMLAKLGMKPNDALREMAFALRQAGLDVTKETMQAMRGLLDAAPAQASRTEWLQTGALALAKGLPLEPQPLAALSRAVFGPPVGQTLAGLAEAVRLELAKPQAGMSQQTSALLQELSGRLQTLLQSAAAFTGGRQAPLQAPTGSAAAVQQTAGSPAATIAAGTGGIVQPQPAEGVGVQAAAGRHAAASAPLPAAAPGPAGSGGNASPQLPTGGQAAEQAAWRAAAGQAGAESAARVAAGASPAAAPEQQAAAARSAVLEGAARTTTPAMDSAANAERPQPIQSAATAPAQAPAADQSWLPRMLKLFGFDHENQALRLIQTAAQNGPDMQAAQMLLPEGADGGRANELASLKSVLLLLSAADDLPLTLREPVQQLLQQVTGQQLLLTPDRSGSFAHVTLFVPFHDKDGQQTAAIHIQSRKSRKGGIDADNCRLWFDLRMAALGPTLVDVQVTDKRVNVGLFNDHPALSELAERGREVLAAALAGAGFQLLSFSQSPYPNAQGGSGTDSTALEHDQAQQLLERNKPYKGVDYRV